MATDALMGEGGGVYVGIMAFVRTQLNCLKRRVNSIHQIVWNCEEVSKTIWLPNVCVLFVQWDTLVSVLLPAGGGGPVPLWRVPTGDAAHLSPLFMLYGQNYGPVPQNKKKGSLRARGKWPKNFVGFCFSPLFFPPSPAPDLCFSHKFLARIEKHVWGSRSHDTHFRTWKRRGRNVWSIFIKKTKQKGAKIEKLQTNRFWRTDTFSFFSLHSK